MQRRFVLTAAVAAAAAAAGLGLALFGPRKPPGDAGPTSPGPADPTGLAAGASTTPPSDPAATLWTLSFEQPSGAPLSMAALRGRWTLLNFWATWCPPCVEELPMLDAFHRDRAAQGWQVVGLAIDGPTPVRQFLARQPVAFPIGLAGLQGTDLGRALGNTTGALPFTVIFDPAGAVRDRKLGALRAADLDDWARRFESAR